ncbi:barley mlo defense gene homolog 4 [Zea mays]|uniref:MLO-like protein n=1 Tax=Zea mays TaxID=4577 RepID=Q94CH1_MAIZE|nr:barley mlo defense gene homolog 4 [Zea mays]AAK38340.1 seven transmembrane protein Mlo4 [Zea mays]ACF80078.1 unknown [Zea mays]ACN33533.1 unknown [Zea mays]AQK58642.1 MLO-like protein 4 [Zea mays]|eukprot:NP_001105169.1 barley mlo defense gene homolog 4 [Zea mays]
MAAEQGRSLAETPTWSVATVTTLMVAACFLVERSLSRFAKWLRKTKRKAMLAALEKIREELMLLGVISLLLSQTARFISEICVPSSLFTSRFYICSESDYQDLLRNTDANQTALDKNMFGGQRLHVCGEGHEPFVSYEGLEQLHRFLFILGITHVLYSFVTVVLSMIKIYSWRKWETLAGPIAAEELKARRTKVMRRQSTFVFNNASHPWSKNKILIWMLCFLRQFKGSIIRSDYLALRLGFVTYHKLPHSYDFHKYMVRSMEDDYNGTIGISWPLWAYAIVCILINVHGINIYFWLSFVPVILVLLVGTELQHVIAQLALEVAEATAPYVGSQLKLRDDLFWFGKPRVLWWLIQFISFQNAFELATFLWSLWELSAQTCFMKHYYMVAIRLISGLLVQFWCSYSTLPLNVIISQMGSKFKKSLVSENVRESLHSWCKRVKDRSRHNPLFSRNGTLTTRSVCSLDTTYETDHETNTVCTLSRTASATSLDDQLTVVTVDDEPSCIEKDV